ncbi:hypothetical protein CDAR_368321 [Caerostris darwini]|uniref:Uncharacterized protein n=1 Tax=Caerostris darwini TaxID=1538125 RepID=A0AAV4WD13_9ARAC|nr:hypothetical protein CDAR_368321 [Caerostris darwini]
MKLKGFAIIFMIFFFYYGECFRRAVKSEVGFNYRQASAPTGNPSREPNYLMIPPVLEEKTIREKNAFPMTTQSVPLAWLELCDLERHFPKQ